MKKQNPLFTLTLSLPLCALATSCAETKSRLWIEPPVGSISNTPRELTYQVENSNGTKENLVIPIKQLPDYLVIEDRKKGNKSDPGTDHASATQADQQIHGGKLAAAAKKKNAPTISYLRGLAEVEGLYHQQHYAEALVKLAPLVEEYPQQTRLLVMQGTLFRKIGEKKLALESYNKAKGLDRRNPEIDEAIAKLQDETGETL
jgi:tetratricopeptide (TPR) repeat protein